MRRNNDAIHPRLNVESIGTSKVELKKQLDKMGIEVEGEYVRKKDVEKILAASKQNPAQQDRSQYTKKLEIAYKALCDWENKYYGIYADAYNDSTNLVDADRKLLKHIDDTFRWYL